MSLSHCIFSHLKLSVMIYHSLLLFCWAPQQRFWLSNGSAEKVWFSIDWQLYWKYSWIDICNSRLYLQSLSIPACVSWSSSQAASATHADWSHWLPLTRGMFAERPVGGQWRARADTSKSSPLWSTYNTSDTMEQVTTTPDPSLHLIISVYYNHSIY